jgi:hypothetical protein
LELAASIHAQETASGGRARVGEEAGATHI